MRGKTEKNRVFGDELLPELQQCRFSAPNMQGCPESPRL